MIKRCKLAILKTTIQKDLAEEYGMARILICPLMNVGDVFYADYAKTEGFCDEELKAIRKLLTKYGIFCIINLIGFNWIKCIKKSEKYRKYIKICTKFK
jgi:predicted xylose isomerase-like sugar epimerase